MNILVVDDDANLRRSLRLALAAMGHRVTEAADGAQAQERLAAGAFDVALLDLRLAREQGLDLLPTLLRLSAGLEVVMMTAYATIETAVEAMRRGAADYLPKPFTPDQIRVVFDCIARVRKLQSHVEDLEEQVRAAVPEADLQTEDPGMRQALEVAFKAAPTGASILIRGESGTGKGVVALAIHVEVIEHVNRVA
jgi:NtrC-family two-component system response regulator AlgB